MYDASVAQAHIVIPLASALVSALLAGCARRCAVDTDCPDYQACVGGACAPLAERPGPDGSADASPDGPDSEVGPADADGGSLPGVPALVATTFGFTDEPLCDLDGDGLNDNALSGLDPVLLAMLTGLVSDSFAERNAVIVLDTHLIPDPETPHGLGFVGSLVSATDCDEDSSDNASGREVFDAIEGYYDEDTCMPTAPGTLSVNRGRLEIVGAELRLYVDFVDGYWTWQNGIIRARVSPGMTRVTEGVCCAWTPARELASAVVDDSRGLTALDIMTDPGVALGIAGLAGAQPDIDGDEDGLETFVTDESGRVVACLDGDGRSLEPSGGAPCTQDPEVQDGFSLTVRFEGVSARLIIPGGSGATCPETAHER